MRLGRILRRALVAAGAASVLVGGGLATTLPAVTTVAAPTHVSPGGLSWN